MARLTLTPATLAGAQGLTLPVLAAGAQATLSSSNTGVQFVNNGQVFLVIYNGTGTQTIAQQIGGKIQGIAPTATPVSLTASTAYLFGPWSAKDYTQLDGSGLMYVDFTGTYANIGVSLYQMSPIP
ncbi:MAG TPA: hypothetical protein VHZ03_15835 [Trebonia sp.]|jgi:hypothetical protein|nr:hypothetical protein [Trebonia sp.]